MLDPLSAAVVTSLGTNETAALAVAMIIAGSFPEIPAFAARVIEGPQRPSEREAAKPPKRARSRPRRGNGRSRRETLDQIDDRLLAAMKANPDARISTLAEAIGKSRTAAISALNGLRTAGLVDSADRLWTLIEQREAPPC
jgi:hypothetical protein